MSLLLLLFLFFLSVYSSHHTIPLASLQLLVDRRKYFESYARENEFDPLIVTNWYAHKDRLLNTKVLHPLHPSLVYFICSPSYSSLPLISPLSFLANSRVLAVCYAITTPASLKHCLTCSPTLAWIPRFFALAVRLLLLFSLQFPFLLSY